MQFSWCACCRMPYMNMHMHSVSLSQARTTDLAGSPLDVSVSRQYGDSAVTLRTHLPVTKSGLAPPIPSNPAATGASAHMSAGGAGGVGRVVSTASFFGDQQQGDLPRAHTLEQGVPSDEAHTRPRSRTLSPKSLTLHPRPATTRTATLPAYTHPPRFPPAGRSPVGRDRPTEAQGPVARRQPDLQGRRRAVGGRGDATAGTSHLLCSMHCSVWHHLTASYGTAYGTATYGTASYGRSSRSRTPTVTG